jgi:hypothetical protein
VGLSTVCSSCHLDTYQATNNPNHSSFGIPTTCEQCHNTVRWGDGTFTHSFPINSGAHSGFSCNQCHTTGVGNAFSCTHCHEHNQSSMNSEHNGVSGYQWLSSRCYQCHPNGRG